MLVKSSRLIAIGLTILLLCGTAFAANEKGREPVNYNFENADLLDVLRVTAKLSKMNIVVEPGLNGRVNCNLNNIPWDKGLKKILKSIHFDMFINGNLLWVYKPGSKTEKWLQWAVQKKYSGEAIDLNLKDADLVKVLQSLARAYPKREVLRIGQE